MQYNNKSFIESDPIQIPHQYTLKEDIEISAFLVATLAWGKRITIIQKSNRLMTLMGNSPYDFILNHSESDIEKLNDFTHRTFNGIDCQFFIKSLHNIYANHSGLENIFTLNQGKTQMHESIVNFRTLFFETEHWIRTRKHVSDPSTGAASKRLHMFLRWMIRRDTNGVDFGLWKKITPAQLICPVDVHVGRVSRHFNLLKRKQVDWLAAVELTEALRQFDPKDPVKYDFALFGLGVLEKY